MNDLSALLRNLLVLLSASVAAPAASETTPPEPDIVVTGRERTARELAEAITPDLSQDSPMARFTSGVCFHVVGVRADFAAGLRARLVENARVVGAPLADEDCSPNALVIFVKDGRAELVDIAARRPHLLDGLSDDDLSRLLAETGSARAWANSVVRGRDGRLIDPLLQLTGAYMSRITLPIRRDLFSSVVLIDVGAIDGLTARQLADYATMRLLGDTRADEVANPDTILSLFRLPRDAAPPGMTAFDRAYLTINYSGLGNERVRTKIGRIAAMLRQGR